MDRFPFLTLKKKKRKRVEFTRFKFSIETVSLAIIFFKTDEELASFSHNLIMLMITENLLHLNALSHRT